MFFWVVRNLLKMCFKMCLSLKKRTCLCHLTPRRRNLSRRQDGFHKALLKNMVCELCSCSGNALLKTVFPT